MNGIRQRAVRYGLAWLSMSTQGLATTWIVDDGGGPGVDFVNIQDAVDAAVDGDVIEVRSGYYPGFTIDGKSLVVAKHISPMLVQVAAGVVVKNLAPEQKVEIVGLRIGLNAIPAQEPLVLEENLGSVRFVGCLVSAFVFEYPTNCMPAFEAMTASTSHDVTLVDCQVWGGAFSYDYSCGTDGAAALVANQCSVTVLDSMLLGGRGGDHSNQQGGNGAPAAVLSGSSAMFAYRSEFWRSAGGHGGCSASCISGTCSSFAGACRPGQQGDGVVLEDGSSMTWKESTFASIVPASAAQEVAFAPYCLGTFRECPCGNNGAGTGGCEHAFGSSGALLEGAGNASVSSDTVTLQVTGLNPNASPTVLLLQGSERNTGSLFADGFHCTGGSIRRLYGKPSASGQTAFGFGQVGEPSLSGAGQVPPVGATRFYQAWYRNEDAAFCTASYSNLSNGVEIEWGP